MTDRSHQIRLRQVLNELFRDEKSLKILAHVVPGGGKSWLPGIIAQQFPDHKIAWFVPRDSLRKQAVLSMRNPFGIDLFDVGLRAGDKKNPSHGLRGFVATQQGLMKNPEAFASELLRHPYIVVPDECHHAKIFGSTRGPNPLATALSSLKGDIWLNMTGTLRTNDNSFIYGMAYAKTKRGWVISPKDSVSHPELYIHYDRETALRENAVVPVQFYHHDGIVAWKEGSGDVKKGRLSEAERDEEPDMLFTALQTEFATKLFRNGFDHWRECGRKLLVVTRNQDDAKTYYRLLKDLRIDVGLAITDEEDSNLSIDRFKEIDRGALVTCQIAYEGLDVPDITHIICLTHIRSIPWIEQMLGRGWRQTYPPKKRPKPFCYAFVPDDPRMEQVIAAIQACDQQFIQEREPVPRDFIPERHVLALSSNVDDVTLSWMGSSDQVYKDDHEDIFSRLIAKHLQLHPDDPQIEEYLEIYRRNRSTKQTAPIQQTPSENAKNLSKQIALYCRARNREYFPGVDGGEPLWGSIEKGLKTLTHKSTTEMNEEELKNAYIILRREWPPLTSGPEDYDDADLSFR